MFAAKKLIRHFMSGKAELTVEAYGKDLEDFRVFAKAATLESAVMKLFGGTHPNGQEVLARYIADMHRRRGLGSATVNRRISTLRSLGKESRILGMVPWVLEAKNVKHENVRDVRGPGLSNIARLLTHMECLPKTKEALRDLAIIRLMTDLALRRGAICKIDCKDFDAGKRELRVREKGKSSKHAIEMSTSAASALHAWQKVHGKSGSAPMFVNFDTIHRTKTGKRLSGSAIYAILKKRAKAAGVEGPIRPHGVRHTSISLAIADGGKKGLGLDKIKGFSGHANVRTLELYDDAKGKAQGELAESVSRTINRRRG